LDPSSSRRRRSRLEQQGRRERKKRGRMEGRRLVMIQPDGALNARVD